MRTLKLNDFEYEFLSAKVGADLLVYISHDATTGLFAKEKKRMKKLELLRDKFDQAKDSAT